MNDPQQKVIPLTIPEDYLTIPQIAVLLRCSKRTVQKMIDRGMLASSRLPGVQRRVLVRKVIFERYCKRNSITVDEKTG